MVPGIDVTPKAEQFGVMRRTNVGRLKNATNKKMVVSSPTVDTNQMTLTSESFATAIKRFIENTEEFKVSGDVVVSSEEKGDYATITFTINSKKCNDVKIVNVKVYDGEWTDDENEIKPYLGIKVYYAFYYIQLITQLISDCMFPTAIDESVNAFNTHIYDIFNKSESYSNTIPLERVKGLVKEKLYTLGFKDYSNGFKQIRLIDRKYQEKTNKVYSYPIKSIYLVVVVGALVIYNICEDQKEKVHRIYFINGMGCTDNDITESLLNNGSIYKTLCNTNNNILGTPIPKDVVGTLCYIKPKQNDFTIQMINIIKEDIKNNYHVLLYGHSYGGALVNLICDQLCKDLDKSDILKIKAATFGSIYISKIKMDLKHYIYLNDISLQCSKVKQPANFEGEYFEKDNIIWMKSNEKRRWDIHNDYFDIISELKQSRTNKINKLQHQQSNTSTNPANPALVKNSKIGCLPGYKDKLQILQIGGISTSNSSPNVDYLYFKGPERTEIINEMVKFFERCTNANTLVYAESDLNNDNATVINEAIEAYYISQELRFELRNVTIIHKTNTDRYIVKEPKEARMKIRKIVNIFPQANKKNPIEISIPYGPDFNRALNQEMMMYFTTDPEVYVPYLLRFEYNGTLFYDNDDYNNSAFKQLGETMYRFGYRVLEQDHFKNDRISTDLQGRWWYKWYQSIPPCTSGRLAQFSGTCWFNSSLNMMMLTPVLADMMRNKWFELETKEQQKYMIPLSSCVRNKDEDLKLLLYVVIYNILVEGTRATIADGDFAETIAKSIKKHSIQHKIVKALDIITLESTIKSVYNKFVKSTEYKECAKLKKTKKLASLLNDERNVEKINKYQECQALDDEDGGNAYIAIRMIMKTLFTNDEYININIRSSQESLMIDGIFQKLSEKINPRRELHDLPEILIGYCKNNIKTLPLTINIYKTIYYLQSAVLDLSNEHQITGITCGDTRYIYDSNNILLEFDWNDPNIMYNAFDSKHLLYPVVGIYTIKQSQTNRTQNGTNRTQKGTNHTQKGTNHTQKRPNTSKGISSIFKILNLGHRSINYNTQSSQLISQPKNLSPFPNDLGMLFYTQSFQQTNAESNTKSNAKTIAKTIAKNYFNNNCLFTTSEFTSKVEEYKIGIINTFFKALNEQHNEELILSSSDLEAILDVDLNWKKREVQQPNVEPPPVVIIPISEHVGLCRVTRFPKELHLPTCYSEIKGVEEKRIKYFIRSACFCIHLKQKLYITCYMDNGIPKVYITPGITKEFDWINLDPTQYKKMIQEILQTDEIKDVPYYSMAALVYSIT